MVIGSCDYTHFTPKHVTNDILKYQVSKMNTKKIGDSRVNRCFPPPEVKNLETRICDRRLGSAIAENNGDQSWDIYIYIYFFLL